MATLAGSALAAVAIGYLLATTYLVLRDDLISAAVTRQARMQQAYEDRISALRAQVDRITSRQLLDQQLVENKVAELLDRQARLAQRHGRLEPMLERAELPAAIPVPETKPEIRAGAADQVRAASLAAYAPKPPAVGSFFFALRGQEAKSGAPSAADRADRLFVEINRSLRSIETEQLARIKALTQNAWHTTGEIAEALQSAGLSIDADYGDTGTGGPLVVPDDKLIFEAEVHELDEALDRLESVKQEARKLPIANPAPGRPVSSGFGMRRDPLLGMPAHHSGMDFRAPTGTPVRASGPGTVIAAGWNGGYGRMVEIDHGDGFTTRYAHLKAISVKQGQKVEAGTVLGKAGSSGRSTGPHLHYEIRRDGDALDPLRFLKAGKKIEKYL
jgi:murein DD-endopeptidase MepM/ murein hydrolase activator NlpD